MKRQGKPIRIMSNFLISYMMILIVPLIFCIYAYTQAISIIDKNAADYHVSMLSQAKHSLEMRIDEARLIGMQIADDETVNSYMYATEQNKGTPFQVWEVQRKLQQYIGTNQYISQAFLGLAKERKAISTTYYHKDLLQGKSLTINGLDNALLSPLFEYTQGRVTKVSISDDKVNEERSLMYSETFPKGVVESAYGNVCLVFDQDKIEGLLTFSNEWSGGYNAILDESNNLLAYSGENPSKVSDLWLTFDKEKDNYTVDKNGEKMSITYLISKDTGWTYLSVYPQKQVLSEALHMKTVLLVYIILSIAVGVLLAIFFAKRNTKPVKHIITTLSGVGELEHDGENNEYGIIQQSLNSLIEKNQLLSEHTQDQKTIVKEAMFRVLLNGKTADAALLEEMAEEIGVSLFDSCFIGICFDIEGDDKVIMAKSSALPIPEYIKSVLAVHFSQNGRTYYISDDNMFALIHFSERERLEIYSVIKAVIKEIEEGALAVGTGERALRLVIGISNTYSSLGEVYRCDEEARFSAEYSKMFEFGRPVFYDSISENINLSKFTLNDYQHLLNILKGGNVEEAQSAFNELIERNIIANRMNSETMEQLFYAVKGVLLEAVDFASSNSIKEDVINMKLNGNDFFASFLTLEEAYIAITQAIGDKRGKKRNTLVKDICAYLHESFADANITLTSAADRFAISEAYLSKLFREYVGDSFASYLESVRINKAKSVLENDRFKMLEIAEQTGYNSVESFRRAFKRITGVAPSEYKQNKK